MRYFKIIFYMLLNLRCDIENTFISENSLSANT